MHSPEELRGDDQVLTAYSQRFESLSPSSSKLEHFNKVPNYQRLHYDLGLALCVRLRRVEHVDAILKGDFDYFLVVVSDRMPSIPL